MKNNTKKYLKYAIGEIVLVVIGILIALQINNWNEANKQEKQEVALLNQVKTDITINSNDLESLIESLKVSNYSVDSVLVAIKKKTFKPRTSIFYSILHGKLFLNNINTGYRRIETSFGSTIKNDTILNSIIELYEIDFDNSLTFQEQMHSLIDNTLYPFTNTHFEVSSTYKLNFEGFDDGQKNFFQPIDLENISNNNTFKNILFQLKQTSENRLKHCEMVKSKINNLISKIDSEIESR
ncbi:MAG: hypothetical protein EVB11_07250 [Winogradskyella sp.]|nr:MAG: hypothetical protein EVB11_07250 [Winogradskyella sp.]